MGKLAVMSNIKLTIPLNQESFYGLSFHNDQSKSP